MAPNTANPSLGLYEIFSKIVDEHPDKVALSYYGLHLTYQQLRDQIDTVALAFKRQGIGHGDIVSISLPNTPESVICFYALNRIGAIPCMFDLRYAPSKICEIIDRTQSKMLFIMDFALKGLAEADKDLHVDKVVVLCGADSIPVASAWYAFAEWFNGRGKVFRRHKRFCHWKDFLGKTREKDEAEPYHWIPDEMAALFHTSGTTGTVKSVMLSTENIIHSVFPDPPILNDIESGDSALCFLPIFSFYGANAIFITLSHGMHMIAIPLLQQKEFLPTLAKFKPQHIFTVPAYWDTVSKAKDFKEDLSFLKSIDVAGDTLNAAYEKDINNFLRERNCRYELTKAYGMTETAGVIAFTPQGCDKKYTLGFSGVPNAFYEIRIFDDEVCVRPKMRLLGYYKNEEATQNLLQTHDDGSQWLHTGDVGYIDEEGYLYVIGRKKRMIVRFDGSKIFPVEIEDCLVQHPAVASCAVVPMQDPNHSESKLPKAFVVLKEADKKTVATVRELMAFCKANLPVHLVPSAIEFIDALPLNNNGKVDYQKLI